MICERILVITFNSQDHPTFHEFNEKFRGDVDKWPVYLSGTSQLCLHQFLKVNKNARFVLDGFTEIDVTTIEPAFGNHCADLMIDMECSAPTMQQRMTTRGRETLDEIAKRLEKYSKNHDVHEKQIKSYAGSARSTHIVYVDAEWPVADYYADAKLGELIEKILASKQPTEGASDDVDTFSPDFIKSVVDSAYASDEFKALCAKLDVHVEPAAEALPTDGAPAEAAPAKSE